MRKGIGNTFFQNSVKKYLILSKKSFAQIILEGFHVRPEKVLWDKSIDFGGLKILEKTLSTAYSVK